MVNAAASAGLLVIHFRKAQTSFLNANFFDSDCIRPPGGGFSKRPCRSVSSPEIHKKFSPIQRNSYWLYLHVIPQTSLVMLFCVIMTLH